MPSSSCFVGFVILFVYLIRIGLAGYQVGGGGPAIGNCFGALDEPVHSLAGGLWHLRGFAENERENLMAGRDFRQMRVGGQRGVFDFADLLGRQCVIEVLGDRVRIGS